MSAKPEGVFPRWVRWAGLIAALLGIVLAIYGLRDRLGADLERATNQTLERSLRDGAGRGIVGGQIADSLDKYVRKPRP
jgi:hypothetical protein